MAPEPDLFFSVPDSGGEPDQRLRLRRGFVGRAALGLEERSPMRRERARGGAGGFGSFQLKKVGSVSSQSPSPPPQKKEEESGLRLF